MDISSYTGINADCGDAALNAVLLENSTYSRTVYRQGTVDYVFFDEAVVLTGATADILYSGFTPTEARYTPGTRVFLEKIVGEVTAGCSSDEEKALALMDWVCAIPETYKHAFNEPFHGGSEEEVIRKGSSMCNEQARVLIILSQIAGIPARYIGHMTPLDYDDPDKGTGHGVTEMFIGGKWAYFDIRGKFFRKDDGSIASTLELVKDPSLISKQPPEVLSHMRKTSDLETSMRWFSPGTVHIVVNYFVEKHGDYDYSWVYPSKSLSLEGREKARRLRVTRHKDILPQPVRRIV